jgi:hypothetical protein
MDSMTYYECFNNKLDEFLKDLTNTFPDLKDIKLLRNGVNIAKVADMKLPQQVFDQTVALKYEKQILEKDENFFMNEDYTEVLSTHGVDFNLVPQLKEVWKSLDESNKDAVWKYMQVLVLLNKKCITAKRQTQ